MRAITVTREIAWAASLDEGNRCMRRGGRKAWNEDDYNAACDLFDRLWTIEDELLANSGERLS